MLTGMDESDYFILYLYFVSPLSCLIFCLVLSTHVLISYSHTYIILFLIVFSHCLGHHFTLPLHPIVP